MACQQRQARLAELEQRVSAIEKCNSDMLAILRSSLGSAEQPQSAAPPESQAAKPATQSSSSATASSSRQAVDEGVEYRNLKRQVERLEKLVASHERAQRAERAEILEQSEFEMVDAGNEAENGKGEEPVRLPPPWPFRVVYTRKPNLADSRRDR
ncbi:hypothetical protein CKM354_001046200 [Cercospora kikuchii]|uniref:Uncharacterized protein n=1 Tax=Cercospora kikuchii TaxID=84275 RepID=A0A9P3FKM3_9PEZI|nr:uncharacterized protein CKM354_001046200 [Cercospora kikuchii]GIZ47369.1 hypothetical protein CKM354_001046200 [Cercospora kikuchii]